MLYFGGVFQIGRAPEPTPTRPPAAATASTREPGPTHPAPVQPQGLIAFESTRDGNSEIYVMSIGESPQGPGASNQVNLTRDPADEYLPVWSPDGRRIAFFSTRTGYPELYAMDADGSNLIRLTDTAGSNTTYQLLPPAWSPDGTRLAAARWKAWTLRDLLRPAVIDLINADGSGATPVHQFDQASVHLLSWSPEGTHLLVAALTRTGYGFWLARAVDPAFQFHTFESPCWQATWSPSGRLTCTAPDQIISLSPDGGSELRLVQSPDNLQGLSWSPDGRYLLASAHPGGLEETRVVWPLDSGLDDPLIRRSPTTADFLSFGASLSISWAPDSQWITYDSKTEMGQSEIYLVNIFDADHPVQLTDGAGENYSPRWQPQPAIP